MVCGLLCGGFGAVLGVGSCSVGLGWFVAGGVGCGRDDCWGFLLGFCAGVTVPPCLWRVCLCVTVGLSCGGSWRVSAGARGLVVVLLGLCVLWGLCFCGGRRAVRVVFGVVW